MRTFLLGILLELLVIDTLAFPTSEPLDEVSPYPLQKRGVPVDVWTDLTMVALPLAYLGVSMYWVGAKVVAKETADLKRCLEEADVSMIILHQPLLVPFYTVYELHKSE